MSLALVRGGNLVTAFALAEKLILPVAKRFGEGRLGGSLCIMTPDGQPLWVGLMGDPEEKKASKYWELSIEKPTRLAGNPDHVSSFQSWDEKKAQYPGAIRGISVLGGFSGLPWKVDEGFVIALFRFRGLISDVLVDKIVQTSHNELAGPIYAMMHQEAKRLDILK